MVPTTERLRLDQALVVRGLVETRSRARDLILRGRVTIGGRCEMRPAAMVAPDAAVAVDGDDTHYVSRGALKLAAALDAFDFDPKGRIALDVGASTGGFSQVLLERGARRVYAVDVGHDQLHARLKSDHRIVSMEGRDARNLAVADLANPIGAIVCDVSFISLTLVLPTVLQLAAPDAWLVALVKPQFEAGREHVGKGGIVRDDAARAAAVDRVRSCISAQPTWQVCSTLVSPIAGGSGNVEFLIGARHEITNAG